MTPVLELFKCQFERNTNRFSVRANLLTAEDQPLLDRKILTFNGNYLKQVKCPTCGNTVDVERHGDKYESTYTLFCPHCEILEDISIPAAEVELLDFHYRSFINYIYGSDFSDSYANELARCYPTTRQNEIAQKRRKIIGRKRAGRPTSPDQDSMLDKAISLAITHPDWSTPRIVKEVYDIQEATKKWHDGYHRPIEIKAKRNDPFIKRVNTERERRRKLGENI